MSAHDSRSRTPASEPEAGGLVRRCPRPALRLGLGLLACAAVLACPAALRAQAAGNLQQPPSEIERYLAREAFTVDTLRGARYPDDKTKQVTLEFEDGTRMLAKWAPAPHGGERFNEAPRYEEAAYQVQKLFLDEDEYVVPPTLCRCVPVWVYREHAPDARPTFDESSCVLIALQAWMWSVTEEGVFDRERFRSDTLYARHLANLNVLTYLIDHKDANKGNFLISTVDGRPRVYAVDNGVSFSSEKGNRGYEWRRLRVERIPDETAERLRSIEREELTERLATFAQFERTESRGMVRVEPGEPIDPDEGIRLRDGVLQLGLTGDEIQDVWERLQELVRRVERGDVGTF